jgi:crossover junction endodeoxyribonuclease RuvC
MLVIGIDPGTASTGYGLVRKTQTGGIELIDYGVIKTSPDESMPVRLQDLHRQLTEIIDRHQPESAAVEKLFFQRNVSTAMSVGQARGVTLLALAEAGVLIEEYTPREVKQAIVGYGGAEKQQIQKMLQTLLDLEVIPSPDDAADALAVAICHLHAYQLQSRLEDEA